MNCCKQWFIHNIKWIFFFYKRKILGSLAIKIPRDMYNNEFLQVSNCTGHCDYT